MAAKKVSMKVDHLIEIGNVDVVFEVRDGTALMGRMKISRGGIDWHPAGAHGDDIKATWGEFKEWMESD